MDVIEMIDERIGEGLEELGKLKPGDPQYKYVTDNIKTLGDVKTNSLREDNTRLNNNEVNDINRMRVEVENKKADIEMARVKVEGWKVGAGVLGDLIDAGKACGFAWIAYNGDKVAYSIRSVIDIAKGYLRQRRH